jgi:hypothetical protein
VALALAAGRTALGLAVLAAPEAVTSRWLGENAEHPAVRYLARSLGARDLALGILTLQTLSDPVLAPHVHVACAVVDSVDAVATVAARKDLPAAGAAGTVLIAGAAAGVGFYLARRLSEA